MYNKFSAKVYPIDDEVDLTYEINKEDIKKFIDEIYKNLEGPDGLVNLPDTSYDPRRSFHGGLHQVYVGARNCGKSINNLNNHIVFTDENDGELFDDNTHEVKFNSVTFDSFDAIASGMNQIYDNILKTDRSIITHLSQSVIEDPNDQKTINKRNKKNMQDFIRNKYDDRRIK